MSLYETADGIFGTHVTWKDVEMEMQKVLNTKERFGDEKKVTNIGDMKGFLSRIALIEPNWTDKTLDYLPEKFVIKISTQLAMIEISKLMKSDELMDENKMKTMGILTRNHHNREVSVYEILEKEEYKNEYLPHTKVYSSKKFENEQALKGWIITEYVPNIHIGMHQCLSIDECIQVLKCAAALSALGEKIKDEEKNKIGKTDILEEVLKEFRSEESMEYVKAKLRESFDQKHKEKVDKMIDIYEEYYGKWSIIQKYSKISEILGHEPVMGHCDLWSANILFQKIDDQLKVKAIVDYQTTSMCSPGQDIARLLACCLSKKDRRENKDELLKIYYEHFIKELDGRQCPYTYKQLSDSYDIYFPITSFLIIPYIAAFAKTADQSDKEAIELSTDKVVGLMEDIMTTHQSNIDNIPLFFE